MRFLSKELIQSKDNALIYEVKKEVVLDFKIEVIFEVAQLSPGQYFSYAQYLCGWIIKRFEVYKPDLFS